MAIAQYESTRRRCGRTAARVGAANARQLPIHVRDVRRREGVVSRERLAGRCARRLAVDGEGDLGGDCAPTLRDGENATWSVGLDDSRYVSKPRVRFTDSLGQVFLVPEDRVVPADATDVVLRPSVPANPCVGVLLDARVGDGTCDAALNFAPCFDGGDCCAETCRDSDGATCGSSGYDCLDRGFDPVTGLEAAGAWASYLSRVGRRDGAREAVARPVTARLGRARAPRRRADRRGVLHAGRLGRGRARRGGGGVGRRRRLGNECLKATVANEPGRVLDATFVTGTGLNVIEAGTDVTLVLTVTGVPRTTPNCTIAGVEAATVTRVANDAGSATDTSAANSTWECARPTLADVDPDIARLIDLVETAADPNDVDSDAATATLADSNPCAVGVVVLWTADFIDGVGYEVAARTAAFDDDDVCYDYRKPDVTRIAQDTTGNPGWAKAGDTVTLTVLLDRPIELPTTATLAGRRARPRGSGRRASRTRAPSPSTPTPPRAPSRWSSRGWWRPTGYSCRR